MTEEPNKYPVKITRKGIVVWSALILFSMGWMFVVGILVGRGWTPVTDAPPELQQELEALKKEKLEEEQAEIEARARENKEGGTHLPFYDELKKPAPKPVYSITPPAPEKRPSAPKPVAAAPTPQRTAPDPPAAPSAAQPAPEPREVVRVQATPAPVVQPAPSATPSALPAIESEDRFTVQAGAFRDVESADRMVKNLRDQGYPAYHLRVDVPGKGVWYRVRVGAFEDRPAAERMLKKMGRDGIRGMVVST